MRGSLSYCGTQDTTGSPLLKWHKQAALAAVISTVCAPARSPTSSIAGHPRATLASPCTPKQDCLGCGRRRCCCYRLGNRRAPAQSSTPIQEERHVRPKDVDRRGKRLEGSVAARQPQSPYQGLQGDAASLLAVCSHLHALSEKAWPSIRCVHQQQGGAKPAACCNCRAPHAPLCRW